MSKDIKGTKNNDILNGDDSNNKIDGKDGDDQLFGWEGNDELKGGKGDDLLDGGEGNDSLKGEKGSDTLFGGSGMDVLDGGDDDDTLNGGIEDDLIDGGKGDDLLEGSEGNDILAGNKGNDRLLGGDGDDILLGDGKLKGRGKGWGSGGGTGKGTGPGKGSGGGTGSGEAEWNNWATIGSGSKGAGPKGTGSKGSGDGSDYLDGGAGNDFLYAWHGDDTGHYQAAENAGAIDLYDGGDGIDTLELELTLGEWMDPVFQGDLENYLQFLEDNTDADSGEANDQAFTFNAFGLTASAWENLAIKVDGVDVNPADEAVTAKDDNFTAVEDGTPTSGNVLDDNGNGADEIPDSLRSVSLASGPVGTLLSLDSEGNFEYDSSPAFQHLAAGETGDDSFTYTVEDADGDTDTATATITVTGVNDMPVVATSGLTGTVTEMLAPLGDLTSSGSLSFSDVDLIDSHSVSSITVLAGTLGSLTPSVSTQTTDGADGVISWIYSVPAAAVEYLAEGQPKVESFVVTLDDGNGGTVDRTVEVTITGTNDGPVVTSSDLSSPVTEMLTPVGDLTSNGNIYFNDVDINNSHSISSITPSADVLGDLTSSVSTQTTGGTGGIISWGYSVPAENVEYLAKDETKLESFVVALDDGNGGTIDLTVEVTLVGTNDAPEISIAAGNSASETVLETNVGLTAAGTLTATDADTSDVVTASVLSVASAGNISPSADNAALLSMLSVTPAVLSGTESTGSLTWNFDSVGEAFDYLAVGENLELTYTIEVLDDNGSSDTQTVTVTITGTNDGPVAVLDVSETDADTGITIDVLANDTDIDGDVLIISSAASDGGGLVQITDNQLQFDPNGDFSHLAKGELEDVTLTYSIDDGHGGTATATATITIEGTNTPPDAVDDDVSIAENNGIWINVLDNDIDPDVGDELTITNVVITNGVGIVSTLVRADGITGVRWEPGSFLSQESDLIPSYDWLNVGESASVTLEYTVEDRSGVADTAAVSITVTGENDAPVAIADSSSTEENTGLLLDVLANDTDIDGNDTKSLDAVTVTSGAGTASIFNNALSWEPGSDFEHLREGESATVEIDYTMSDTHGVESSSTVTITVNGSNDAPVADDDSGTTDENASLTLDVMANDHDKDTNDAKTLQTVNAASGSANIVGNQLVWNPGTEYDYLAADESATTQVSYTMSDNDGATSTATATITVNGSNDDPVAVNDVVSTDENAPALTLDVLDNDTDADRNDTHTLDSVNFASGAASIVNNRLLWNQGTNFDYLAAGESATVVGTYIVSDNHGGSDTGQVEITVDGVNDAPQAITDSGETDAESSLLLDVLLNDTDRDTSDVLTITSASSTGGGIVNLVPHPVLSNQLQFDPNGQFGHLTRDETEEVTLLYTISDGSGGTDTINATVTVVGVNTDPIAVADTAQVNEDVSTVQVSVLGNDIDPDAGEVLTVTQASVLAGLGSVTTDGSNVTWTSAGAYEYLAAGQSAIVSLGYTVTDSLSASDNTTLTLTVVGSNDSPQLATAVSSASIQEIFNVVGDSTQHQQSGIFNFSDVDIDDAHSLTITPASGSGYLGTLTANITNVSTGDGNGQITWDYAVTDSTLDGLKAGQIQEQSYRITIDDGQGGTVSHDVAINLNGDHDDGDVAPGNNAPVLQDDSPFTTNYNLAGFSLNSAGNDHYYKWVPANVDWFEAKAAADAAGGYLVTITSAQENDFVDSLANGSIWLAGSDLNTEGDWRWNSGPDAGTQFWSGGPTGSAPSGAYDNWTGVQETQIIYHEPNTNVHPQWGDSDYAKMVGKAPYNGQWIATHSAGVGGLGGHGYVLEIDAPLQHWVADDQPTTVSIVDGVSVTTYHYHAESYVPDGWLQNPDNGHYYLYQNGGITIGQLLTYIPSWTPVSDTNSDQWSGISNQPPTHLVEGYAVTITSQQENDFVHGVIGNNTVWIAASDASGSYWEGNWRVIEEGVDYWSYSQFWSGDSSGSSVNGLYENWYKTESIVTIRSEPDNGLGIPQDYLEMQQGGSWNDTPLDTSGVGYVIEIGGRPGDPDQPVLTAPNEDQSVTIAGADLLANDYDLDGDLIVIDSISPSTAGGASLSLIGGDVVFNPGNAYQHLAQGDVFTDTFNYTIHDGPLRGGYATGQVSIPVTGVNDAPIAGDDIGASVQDSLLFLNVLGNDTDIDDGSVLNIVAGTTQSSEGSDVLASANGDIRYAAHSASLTALPQGQTVVDTFSYTLEDSFGGTDTATVSVTVTGINDRPITVADHVSGNEDSLITGDLIGNDYDPDTGDNISMFSVGSFTSARGGSVTINPDGSFSYTGTNNFSGADSFNYVIEDSLGLQQTGIANITVNGVADVPTASLTSGAASRFNDVSLVVTAGLTDISESGSFVFTGVPGGVNIVNQQGQNVTTAPISFFGSSQSQTFTLELPNNQAADFDIGITATSTELATLSSASGVSNTENITMTLLNNSETVDFTATDQNMWATGNAILFSDVTTIDILEIHQGGTIINSSFDVLIEKYDVDLSASIDVDIDLVSTLNLNAGSVDAEVPYIIDMTSTYNANADRLRISTSTNFNSGGSQDGSFDTTGPTGSYSLDLVFDTNVTVDLDIDRSHWAIEWSDTGFPAYIPYPTGGHTVTNTVVDWHPNVSFAPTLNLFSFDDSDLSGSVPLPLPLSNFTSLDYAWPSLDTSSDPGSDNEFTSSGTSNDMVALTLDADEFLTYAMGWLANPFDLSFGGSFGPIDVNIGLELLDATVLGAVNFVQDFTLEFNGLTASLQMEDGTILPYNLGDDIEILNASQYDSDGDGDIDVSLIVAPDTQFTNDTDLGFDLEWALGLVKPSVDVSVAGQSVLSQGGDFMWEFGERVQVASIDVFEDTFDFNFDVAVIGVPVDTSAYLV